jgi:hypothetical protein
MDDAIGGLIGGLFLLSLAIAAAAFVVVAALVAVVVLGPPVAAAYAIKRLITHYRLSSEKKRQCGLCAGILFLLPLLSVFAGPDMLPFALWSGVTMSLSGLALFLAVEGFRQHFSELAAISLRHRLGSASATLGLTRARFRGWLNASKSKSMQRRFGKVFEESRRMEGFASEIMSLGDARFLSSERLRLSQSISRLGTGEIALQLQQTLSELRKTTSGDLRNLTLSLHASVLRRAICDRQVEPKNWHAWRSITVDAENIRSSIDSLSEELSAHRSAAADVSLTIRQKKRQILPLS